MKTPLIRALLIDISGTLLVGSSPIPGAAQALEKLRTVGIPFRFCSNTSKESSDAVHKRMRAAGLDVQRAEVWTSVGALRTMLKELGVKKPYMLLSQSALEECCDDLQTEDGQIGTSVSSPLSYDAVVVGLAPALLDYAHLNTAFRILIGEDRPRHFPSQNQADPNPDAAPQADQRPHPPLIALHKARYLEASDHALSLGPGPFVTALEDAARTSATVVGKPTRAFFETVLRDLSRDLDSHARDVMDYTSRCPPSRGPGSGMPSPAHRDCWEGIAVIGDDVQADLGEGAVELGLWRVLVKTGKYRPGDEGRPDVPPDQVCASFTEFVGTLLEQQKTSS